MRNFTINDGRIALEQIRRSELLRKQHRKLQLVK